MTYLLLHPDECKRVGLMLGELHEQMHDAHATAMLGWTFHLEPACALTGALKVHTSKMYAKEHNEKPRFIFF